jgi:hypothetical protein
VPISATRGFMSGDDTLFLAMRTIGSSARSVETLKQERPLDRSRLAADRATLATLQGQVRAYQAEKGQATTSSTTPRRAH